MKASKITFSETNSFSQLVLDYLDQDPKLSEFISFPPSLEGILQAAQKRQFSQEARDLLAERLKLQYDDAKIKVAGRTEEQISSLKNSKTFTITTGHQLGVMGGPLYFLYKIVSVIKLSRTLKEKYPDYEFIPVFWMASEDHDFEEIDHFQFKGTKYQWKRAAKGAVGRLNTEGLKEVFEPLFQEMEAYSSHAAKLKGLIEKTYLKYENYAQASRAFVHQLFAEEGLLIIDGDDIELKRSFIPEMKEELTSFSTEKQVNEQSEKLGKDYKLQVNPRQINLFLFNDTESQTERRACRQAGSRSHFSSRERIEKTKDGYALVESGQEFSETELYQLLEKHPDRFSPNVLMRPMYQEKILPNLAYVGGGGELAYWFQLKQNFEHFQLDFPVLILRNSVLYLNQKQAELKNKLQLTWPQLFEREGDLIKKWVIDQDNEKLLIQSEKREFEKLWQELKQKSLGEDASLGPFVEAEEAHLQNWLDRLADKLIRAQRRKESISVERIKKLKAELYPGGGLQERKESLIELYLMYGDELVPKLIENFDLPADEFLVLEV